MKTQKGGKSNIMRWKRRAERKVTRKVHKSKTCPVEESEQSQKGKGIN